VHIENVAIQRGGVGGATCRGRDCSMGESQRAKAQPLQPAATGKQTRAPGAIGLAGSVKIGSARASLPCCCPQGVRQDQAERTKYALQTSLRRCPAA
jgi:hypothetical protein